MTDLRDLERLLGQEQAEAHGLAADLVGLAFEDRRLRVQGVRRFQTASFIELAMTLARQPDLQRSEAREWAQLAVDAADRAESRRAAELRPLAWAVLGNHHRCHGELHRAGAAMARSERLRHEIADPLELAECLSLQASYWREVRDFDRANRLLDESQRIAALFGGPTFQAKLHVQRGTIAVEAEDWAVALHHLRKGACVADQASEQALLLVALHNLATVMVELGSYEWASASLCELEPLYQRHGTAKLVLQGQWLLARCALGRQHPLEATARLRTVRDAFLAERDLYFAALVELDLVEAHTRLHDWQSAHEAASAAAAGLSTVGATAEALVAMERLSYGIQRRLKGLLLESLLPQVRRSLKT